MFQNLLIASALVAVASVIGCTSDESAEPEGDAEDGGMGGETSDGVSAGADSAAAGAAGAGGVGGAGGAGGAGTMDCGGREEPECEATLGCEPLYAQARGEAVREYAGCRYSGTGGQYILCHTTFTCAYPEADESRCLRFPSSCLPPGWTSTSCGEGACPSLSGD